MQAPGYFVYLPPTAIQARFVMAEESSKTLYNVNLATPNLGNPPSWLSEGISSATTEQGLAIMIPVPLNDAMKQYLASHDCNPEFVTGKLVSIKKIENGTIHGRVIGQANLYPMDATSGWDMVKDKWGRILHDEIKSGLLTKVFGGRNPDRGFVHPEVLSGMSKNWHEDATVLNTELGGTMAGGLIIQKGDYKWMLNEEEEEEDDEDNDDDEEDED